MIDVDWKMTAFDQKELSFLLTMLDGAKSERLAETSRRLKEAAKKINDAAVTLQTKTGTVMWDGDAAAKFRTWSSELTTSAFGLSQYTEKTAIEIGLAGEALARAKSAIPAQAAANAHQKQVLTDNPDAGGTINPATGRTALEEAKDKEAADKAVVVQQLTTLSQAYVASWERIVALPKPTVVRPADVMNVGNRGQYDELDDDGATVGLTAAAAAGAAAASQTSLSGTSTSANPTPYTAPGLTTGAWPPPQVSGVPGVVTAPGAPLPGTLPPGANPPGQVPTTGLAQIYGGNPPVTAPGIPSLGGSGVGNAPPPTSVGMPTTGGGRMGGLPVSARGSSKGIIGGQQNSTARSGPASGRTVSGSSGLRTGGVEGGMARPGQMGSEPHGTTSGRTGMPMGGGGATSPGGGIAGARNASGRPPIGAPGGVVGGSPGRGAPTGRREFSSGGSGLRSGLGQSAHPEATPGSPGSRSGRPMGGLLGSSSAASEERARRRQRADYLEEDNEYWGGRGPGSVPPVIG